ncbi:hypothetical protein [Lentzea sp. CC55]|uniref:hypothetical protein n=1 Tax=Lentzea sp. CC55 TaxID=2884909 RepID=UPI001F429DD6|nr:hypothetical protein [Lentzea sp. CC55]MCG8921041.1 hypothetical protein [Lentzea sp. CC55]
MATRAHARPEAELVEIVRQYSGLESIADARRAIRELLIRGWIQQTSSYGTTLTHQVPNLRELIATELGDEAIPAQLLAMRANLEPHVRVLGAMKDEVVYHTFMDLLRSAQQEICLPMLATTPYDETVRILRERADAGVRVRILLAVPSLVAKWRGETMRSISAGRIRQWVECFSDRDTVEVRLSSSQEDMELATCVSVDGGVVRYDIYDPYSQRSLEGVMVEVGSPQGLVPNLVRLFQRVFDDAWDRSVSPRRFAMAGRFLKRWWKLWLTIAVIAAAFIPVGVENWAEILIGIGGGIGAPFILEEAPKAYRRVQRWRAQ